MSALQERIWQIIYLHVFAPRQRGLAIVDCMISGGFVSNVSNASYCRRDNQAFQAYGT
jgi:hypothetical protein